MSRTAAWVTVLASILLAIAGVASVPAAPTELAPLQVQRMGVAGQR